MCLLEDYLSQSKQVIEVNAGEEAACLRMVKGITVCVYGGEFPEGKSKENQILTITLFLYESQRSVLYKSHSLLLNTALFAYDMRTFFTL